MTRLWRSAIVATALTGLSVAMPSASAQDAGNGYGPPPDYADAYAIAPECNPANYAPDQAIPPACLSQAYCDQYGCPDDFYDMPIWYGPVFYNSVWFAGPVYYRIWHGQRQYWIHGGWHFDTWRGQHPSWWNAGHYHTGPALGRAHYQNHGPDTAASGVRVWRGTQASTYYDSNGGFYYRSRVASRAMVSPANVARAATPTNVGNLHVVGSGSHQAHTALSYYRFGSHNYVGLGGHSFRSGRSGGYHGR